MGKIIVIKFYRKEVEKISPDNCKVVGRKMVTRDVIVSGKISREGKIRKAAISYLLSKYKPNTILEIVSMSLAPEFHKFREDEV